MTMLSIAIALHALAAVFWVGGMAFAHGFLRPASGIALAAPERQRLWFEVFSRFFPGVWISIAVLLVTGYWMVLGALGGFSHVGVHVNVMQTLGIVMMLLFAHVYFAPWRRFRRAVASGDNEAGGKALAQIRTLVGINLALGAIVVAVAASGRYWP